VHPNAHPTVVGPAGDAQQLDHAAHRPGARHVGGADLGDALAVDVGGPDPGVEGQAGQDGRLGRGVEALDIGCRVRLGVTERRRVVERLAEPGAGGVHRRQDEVGGAVHDAGDPGDPVSVQRLPQRSQQRDRPGDGSLVVQVGAALHRGVVQRPAVLGQQGLIRGDDTLTRPQRLDQPGARRLDAADHLDDHVDVVTLDQAERVGGEQLRLDRQVTTVPAGSTHGDADDLDRRTDPGRQVVCLLM
jgi:hypothetical protein